MIISVWSSGKFFDWVRKLKKRQRCEALMFLIDSNLIVSWWIFFPNIRFTVYRWIFKYFFKKKKTKLEESLLKLKRK